MGLTRKSKQIETKIVVNNVKPSRTPRNDRLIPNPYLQLQQTIGNQAVARLLGVQLSTARKSKLRQPSIVAAGDSHLQRTLNDGHDLTSPRFSKIMDLEDAYDNQAVIRKGSTGRGVQAIQQCLYDLGYRLPGFGADGNFGTETEAAVKAFQRANPPLVDDGKVGPLTMGALDAKFGAPVLPSAAVRAARWDADRPSYANIRSMLGQWSPHTLEVLRTRITLKSYDSISWNDEMWDGTAWVPSSFPGGGYNTGTEIGIINDSLENTASTLYHEVLHAEQPTTHRTTRNKENYAYRIGEEFNIAMGLSGQPALRSAGPQGRQYADPTKVNAFVAAEYPSVPSGGSRDEIIDKAPPPNPVGSVIMERPDGTRYVRAAKVGEKVPGPMVTVPPGGMIHPTAGWTYPP